MPLHLPERCILHLDADAFFASLEQRDDARLSVSIGLGSSKLISRVATRQAKPGKLIRVPAGDERAYLAPWPVRLLPGVGGKVGGRLERLNIARVAEVATMPLPVLRG